MESISIVADYGITATFIIAFIISMIFGSAIQFLFKSVNKVQFYTFMMFLSMPLPFMI